jgi:hypothetical protein
MGRYADHRDFAANAPMNYREDTTTEAYLEGMARIAPPGMRPKAVRGRRFEERTDFSASTRWHRNYDLAMFGDTDIPGPSSETKQKALEGLIDHIARRPRGK